MRRTLPACLTAVALLSALGAGSAHAQDTGVSGSYDIKYEEMSNNCDKVGMSLARGQLAITVKANALTVDIERIPLMNGLPAKTGKINAKSKSGPTSIQGLDGVFSVAGRVNDGMLQLVFVAEYSAKGKGAICTQSWNISGLRKDKVDGAAK